MLMGASGSGKTHSIKTLLDAGLEVFVLFTEPGQEVLADTDPERLHWHYVPAAAPDFAAMIDSASKINKMSLKMLADMSDINKSKYTGFIEMLTALSSFTCDRTGKNYGSADNWGPDKVLVVDSLSGLNLAAMNLVTGSKPVKSMADWGIAIDLLERLIVKLCVDLQCHMVLTAHLEREVDEITGGTTLMASTLGRKLAPKLPRFFSEVVHVRRDGEKFTWSTSTTNVETKTRNLAIKHDLPPTFVGLIENWKKHNEAAA